MNWLWIIFGGCFLIFLIGSILEGSFGDNKEENWEVVKRGNAGYVVFGGTVAIVIERNRITNKLRAFRVEAHDKEPINIDFAIGLIGKP